MSTAAIKFPLSPIRSETGLVPEPIIPIGIWTPNGLKLYDFLVDSGADLTLLPKGLSSGLGINLKRCSISQTQGVEGGGIKIYHSKIKICIGQWNHTIRCAFAEHDQIPPLLGRLDVFSKYNITFHAGKNCIIFQNK